MHKHYRGKGKKRFVNQNRSLSASDSAFVRSLLDSVREPDDGTEYDLHYLKAEYLSKFCDESLTPAALRRSSAIKKWVDTERLNAHTNSRLRGLDRGFNILPRVTWYQFLRFAQRLIGDVLGPLSDELVLGSFSGGASTSRRRTESSPSSKFVGLADVTPEASKFVDVIHRLSPLLRQENIFTSLREVDGAVLFTVPKKTDIDRCACKEPDINMFLQKGVGAHIRRRLLRFGQDLNDQSRNRRLARVGSLTGALATLDLSAASDSMTISAVQALLPTDWFLYLNDIRSRSVVVDGATVPTEMFSSMGNGFTFELESLIFWALARTVSYFRGISGVISVYGDDIILPCEMYDYMTWVLGVFGFRVNPDKSFSTGPFRESCGGHYFNGDDVTPFYLKREATRLTDVIRVANQLRRWAFADPARQYVHEWIFPTWEALRDMVPEGLWGGSDYSVDTQLVTPHAPRKRLVRITDEKQEHPLGLYLNWHCLNWNRRFDPTSSGFDPVVTVQRCRLRPAPSGAAVPVDLFYKELVPDTAVG